MGLASLFFVHVEYAGRDNSQSKQQMVEAQKATSNRQAYGTGAACADSEASQSEVALSGDRYRITVYGQSLVAASRPLALWKLFSAASRSSFF